MFSEKSINFLVENHAQNSKDWFNEHKTDYLDYVEEPLAKLVTILKPVLHKIDENLICETKIDKSISRIYRDTRFSKDKSLYRNNAWCVFSRDKKLYEGPPAFYFEISPSGFGYGCGYYAAGKDSMESLRELIADGSPLFADALSAYEKQNLFAINGERYKKSKHPEKPDKIKDWLDRKSISFNYESADFEMLFSEKLPGVLAEGYKILEPIYNLMMKAEEKKAEKYGI